MGKRTESLYPHAKDVADRLADRLGNQKLVLSAGVILLSKIKGEDREVACQEAKGDATEQLDLYAERAALLEAKEWIFEMRFTAARTGEREARTLFDDLMEILDKGLNARIRREPSNQTEEASSDRRLARSKKDRALSRQSTPPQKLAGSG